MDLQRIPANDISRGTFGIAKVRTTFAGAFSIMTAKAYNHANMISARRDRRYVQLQTRTDPEALSILASVMGVTQEVRILVTDNLSFSDVYSQTINQRRLVQEVYDKRVLHRMLGMEPGIVVSSRLSEKRFSGKDTREAADSVKAAWEEADNSFDANYRHVAEPEEEGRYGIDSRLPPRKRRRLDNKMDAHVYISDDDDDDDDDPEVDDAALLVHTAGDSDNGSAVVPDGSEEEDAYDLGDVDEDADSKHERVRRTRSYWLSKGIGV